MAKKIRIVVLYGGKSAEHDISCRSAAYVLRNLDASKYIINAIAIDQEGRWLPQNTHKLLEKTSGSVPILEVDDRIVTVGEDPASRMLALPAENGVIATVVFPVLHGTYGEDGRMQGLLEMADVAYIGSDHLGSSLGMDKDVAKRLVQHAGIPVVPWVTIREKEFARSKKDCLEKAEKLGFPLFVKPANLGSSVGISKVEVADKLAEAIAEALRFDTKILIEKGLSVREIECAVIGGENPKISQPGEVVTHTGFYSYEAKYVDAEAVSLKVPAELSADQIQCAREMARQIFTALELYGLARVDLFLDKMDGQFYFNEVNTLPGFTEVSQYPMLWQQSGVSASDLLDELISLAIERQEAKSRLSHSR